jgi:hypothetical protein
LLEIVFAAAVVIVMLVVLYKFYPRHLKQAYFVERWKKLQTNCKNKNTWPKALEDADRLLKKALNKKKLKGKSMGEKMVSAQRIFTDNDALWHAHNLYKKIVADDVSLKESEMKDALVGFRQALRDLGALPKNESDK